MRVLVTGGAGFVGRRFCQALLIEGHEVVCVDSVVKHTGGIRPREGWFHFKPLDYNNFSFYEEDCRDFFARLPNEHFDEVYHLAAIVGGRVVIEKSPLAVADDLAIDAVFWQWVQTNAHCKVIYFSSSAAYPVSYQTRENYRLLKEEDISLRGHIGVPDLTYGWAKLTGEYLARLAHERYGIRSVIYRPFSGYGEDQDVAYPLPAICLRALRNRYHPSLEVWGSGRQMRDFIHIDDCVRGVLLTKDLIEDGSAVNLSNGQYISFIDLAAQVAAVLGYAPRVVGASDQPAGVFARAGDTTLQRKLGFTPALTLTAGITGCLRHLETAGGPALAA